MDATKKTIFYLMPRVPDASGREIVGGVGQTSESLLKNNFFNEFVVFV